jgi:hypothetical protein
MRKVQDIGPNGPRLIGLCGLAGAGKTTAAEVLEAQGYERISFAAPLKAAFDAVLMGAGVDALQAARMIRGDLKEVPLSILGGHSPRHAMQTLGTEWGRTCMGADFWVGIGMARAEAILAAGGRVVIDDVRFLNEAAAIRGNDAAAAAGEREVWLVRGRGGIPGDHPSEGNPADLLPDMVLDNGGSREALEAAVLAEVLG